MEAKIVSIIDKYKVAINKGLKDGVKKDDIFMILEKGDELFDPDTKESLGVLEVPKLKMRVANIQHKLTTLESVETTISKGDKKTIIEYPNKQNSNIYNVKLITRMVTDGRTETIIEEKPKEKIITIYERGVKVNNIARKIN